MRHADSHTSRIEAGPNAVSARFRDRVIFVV
jgi:hypothetical protein